MAHVSPPAASRIRNLDCLRGVAILLVLGRHDGFHWLWYRVGWGVDFFFVLSGFLVSGLIFREYQSRGKVNMQRFWLRRAFRIYPPFLVMLFVSVAVRLFVSHQIDSRRLFAELTWTQNYLPGMWASTWSLAVEEHFYLILPIVLGLLIYRQPLAKDPFKKLPAVMLVIAVVMLGARILTSILVPKFAWAVHYSPTHLRLDSLFFGVTLSYAYNFHQAELLSWVRSHRWALGAFSVMALLMAGLWPIESWVMHTVGLTILYLGWGTALLLALTHEFRDWLPLRMLSLVGATSYSIYLWHLFVLQYVLQQLLRGEFPHRYGVKIGLYVVLSIAVGYLLHRFVELPSIQLRNKLFPNNGEFAGSRAKTRLVSVSEEMEPGTRIELVTSRLQI
jgi:peptidoglycan/LPS O-acetylase OafA/YrhL